MSSWVKPERYGRSHLCEHVGLFMGHDFAKHWAVPRES